MTHFHVTSDSAPVAAQDWAAQDWAARDWTAGKLAVPLPSLSVAVNCGEVFDWFAARPDQAAAAVLHEDGRIAGLVNRLQFLARYAQRYYPELYARRSILNLANTQPLIVDEKTPVAELGASVALEHPEALSECFIVTAGGRYLGVGTGAALMRSKVALLQMQETALSRALARSHEAVQSKTNFLALMSHELRTPLNAIIGFSEVMKGEIFGPLGQPRYREYTTDIHAAGSHLLALINDILDLSKAEAGKLDLHPEAVDVGDLVGECVRLTRERARSGGLKLTALVPPDLPELDADRLRLKQVLLNLLSNAIKFTPPGGHVEVRAWIDNAGCIAFAIADSGIGMSAEQIPLALEPFRQIDSPLSRNREGTGLGLSLVKQLAERHGAELSIDSMLGKGTTVSVIFPAARTLRRADAICA